MYDLFPHLPPLWTPLHQDFASTHPPHPRPPLACLAGVRVPPRSVGPEGRSVLRQVLHAAAPNEHPVLQHPVLRQRDGQASDSNRAQQLPKGGHLLGRVSAGDPYRAAAVVRVEDLVRQRGIGSACGLPPWVPLSRVS
jgi:hypothetical protein